MPCSRLSAQPAAAEPISTACPRQILCEAMRLLLRSDTGQFSFTKDLVGDDTIPPYAILSHTWGADTEEVTFEDLTNGTGKDKPGYKKIRFCGEQARQDDLQYFWIDTCCINKANYTELSQAINSMFRWYRDATRCYVYLPDVSNSTFGTNEEFNPRPWESDFRKSRWFKRGWTLQELLAPSSVEFFSQERQRLGDKRSLKQQIHEITGIADSALQGAPLSQFSVDERLSWIERRQTKLEEDKAYSLLGIFDVSMPLIYGEGREKAFRRLQEEIGRRSNVAEPRSTQFNNNSAYTVDDIGHAYFRALRCPDTLLVKNRLKEKDKLLYKSIDWILQDPKYVRWQDEDDICLLWIKGGAGKGKTMMSIGLTERLSLSQDESTVVTYFFCQNANYELNTIEAIIKGLILRLVNQQKELNEPLQRRWDSANERFNEDITSWRTLWDIFLEILDCCKSRRVYVIVDALDECQDEGMADFLKLIVRNGFSYPSKIKWLLTSRPLDNADRALLAGSDQMLVSLELNSKHVSEAVKIYIATRAAELDRLKSYGIVLRRKIEAELTAKAEDTFLWVSLVCQRLEDIHRDKALTAIQELPPGLRPFYDRILKQLSKGESAVVEGCIRLLKVMLVVYRPLTVEEVSSVTGLSNEEVAINSLVDRCASFVRKRDANIEFVHQSARDYLGGKDGQYILDSHEYYGHDKIALSCLSYLSQRLKVNLVDLLQPDSNRESMKELEDKRRNVLLASVDYAATFWVRHLEGAKRTLLIQNALGEQGEVGAFLGAKLLEWLECLSLLDQLPRAIEALKILRDVADVSNVDFRAL